MGARNTRLKTTNEDEPQTFRMGAKRGAACLLAFRLALLAAGEGQARFNASQRIEDRHDPEDGTSEKLMLLLMNIVREIIMHLCNHQA